MKSGSRWIPLLVTLLAPLGGLLVWLAERFWPGTAGAPYLAALGSAAVVAALVLSLPLFAERGHPPGRNVPGTALWLAAPQALFLLALALYYAGVWLPAGKGPDSSSLLDWAALAFGGWVLALLAGVVLYAFVTLARLAQRGAPGQDARRIAAAGSAGLSLALLIVLVALLYIGFARLPWEWNVAYFKITRPSEATGEVAQGISDPVEVGVFLGADSELAPFIRGYFEALQAMVGTAGALDVRFLDADLDPDEAEAFNARGNGWVVLRKGALNRPIRLGDDLERARTQLRTFDRTFFSRLVELSQPPAVVYLTVGHGERTERGRKPESSFSRFRTLLGQRNYTVKELGLGSGLGERVPDDAALVVLAAPSEPFLPSEAESLRTFLEGGGRALAFLEPGPRTPARPGLPGTTLEELLKGYGVEFDGTVQANDRIHARRTHTKADRSLLVTVAYQEHPAVQTLKRAAGQSPLLLLGAGALRAGTAPAGLKTVELVKGMAGTWGDVLPDFEFDRRREQRGEPIFGLAVAPEQDAKPRRAKDKAKDTDKDKPAGSGATLVVYADADLASDLLLQNRANQQLVEDTVSWLVRRDAPPGLPASEEDVRIQHATGDDWLWFYLPVLGVPALVLGLGVFRVTRQRRRRGGSDA